MAKVLQLGNFDTAVVYPKPKVACISITHITADEQVMLASVW